MNREEALLMTGLLLIIRQRRRRRRIKKKKKYWVHPLLSQRHQKGLFCHLVSDLRKNETKFFQYFRMSINSYDELLTLLQERLRRQDTVMRKAVSAEEKLVVTLR